MLVRRVTAWVSSVCHLWSLAGRFWGSTNANQPLFLIIFQVGDSKTAAIVCAGHVGEGPSNSLGAEKCVCAKEAAFFTLLLTSDHLGQIKSAATTPSSSLD